MERLATADSPEAVESLMTESFGDRRHLIVCEKAAITIIKERYPGLFSVKQVRQGVYDYYCIFKLK